MKYVLLVNGVYYIQGYAWELFVTIEYLETRQTEVRLKPHSYTLIPIENWVVMNRANKSDAFMV